MLLPLFLVFSIGWDLAKGGIILAIHVLQIWLLVLPLGGWCKLSIYHRSFFWQPFLIYLSSYLSKKNLLMHGLKNSQSNSISQHDCHSILFKRTNHNIAILIVHVDDIVIAKCNQKRIDTLICHLRTNFCTKDLGKLHYFLGIGV